MTQQSHESLRICDDSERARAAVDASSSTSKKSDSKLPKQAKIDFVKRKLQKPASVVLNPDRSLEKNKKKTKKNDIKGKRDQKYSYEPQSQSATTGSESSNRLASLLVSGYEDEVHPQVFGFELDLGTDAREAVDGLTEALKDMKVKVQLDDSSSSLKSVSETITNGIANVKVEHKLGSIPGVSQFLQLISGNVPTIMIVLLISVMIVKFMPTTDTERSLFMVLILSVCYQQLKDSSIADYISTWFSNVSISPQVGSTDDVSTLISGILNMYLCASSGNKIFSPMEMSKVIGTMSRTGSGVKAMADSVAILIRYMRDAISIWYDGKNDKHFVLSGHAYIDEFLSEANSIKDLYDSKSLYGVQSAVDRVKQAISLGNSIVMKIPGHHDWISIRLVVNNCISELVKIKKSLLNTNFQFTGVRQEPVAIMLRGAPGVGKSAAMQHIAHALAALTFSEEDYKKYREQPSTFIYNRAAEGVYWDGYDQNKRFVFFDDLLQPRDVEGMPDNEIMNIIRAVNVFENQLHCAAIEQKGTTMLRSDFLIANSNITNYNFKSINESGAFLRRWDIVVDICPKSAFSSNPEASLWERRLDHSKLPIKNGVTRMHPDMLEYHLMTRTQTGFTHTGKTMHFNELVNRAESIFNVKKKWQANYLSDLEDTLLAYRPVQEEVIMDDIPAILASEDDSIEMIFNPHSGSDMLNEPNDISDQWISSHPITFDHQHSDYDYYGVANYINLCDVRSRCPEYSIVIANMLNRVAEYILDTFGVRMSVRVLIVVACYDADIIRHYINNGLNHEELIFDSLVYHLMNYSANTDLYRMMHQRSNGENPPPYSIEEDVNNSRCEPQVGSDRSDVTVYEMASEDIDSYRVNCEETSDHDEYFDELRSIDYEAHIAAKALYIRIYHILTVGYFRPTKEKELIKVFRDLNIYDYIKNQLDEDEFVIDYELIDLIISEVLKIGRETSKFSKYLIKGKSILTILLEKFQSGIDVFSKLVWEAYSFCFSYLIGVSADITLTYLEEGSVASLTKIFSHTWKPALIVISASILIKGICYMFNSPDEPGVIFPESDIRSNRHPRARVKRLTTQSDVRSSRTSRTRVIRKPLAPHSIMNTNTNMMDAIRSMAKRNLFEMWRPIGNDVKSDKTHELNGFVLGIVGRCVLMPFHFMSQIAHYRKEGIFNDTDLVQFVKVTGPSIEYNVTVKDLCDGWRETTFGDSIDLTIVCIPDLQPCRDIQHLFATEKQIDLYQVVDSVLLIPFKELKECWPVSSRRLDKPQVVESDSFCPYTIKRTYKYNAHTTGGDCGALLFVNDKFHGSVIIGMHVAGSTKTRIGVSSVISRDIIKELLSSVDNSYQEYDQLELELDPIVPDMDNMEVIGLVKQSLGTRSTGRSKIVRTPLYEAWGPAKTSQSHLKPFLNKEGNLIDPMAIARSKYCKTHVYIPNEMLEEARISLQDNLRHTSVHVIEPEILSFNVAVLGDRSSYFNSIPRVTSAGFPYNTYPGKKTKERFFGSDLDYNLDTLECDDLRQEVELIINRASKGIRSTHVFIDCAKDERRKLSKVDQGNVRMFSCAPTPLLISHRMYFGAFQKWLIMNGIENGTSISVTEYSDDWDFIARKLLQFGEKSFNIGAGDYKNFDMCEQPSIHWQILQIINEWYDDPEGNKIRSVLWFEVVNSLHLHGRTLMYWPSSLPSGHPMTPFINDLYNHMIFRLGWIDIFGSVTQFNTHCYLITKGDDNCYSVNNAYKSKFNEVNLQLSFAKFGMEYTPENKEEIGFSKEMRNIEEVTFLKRHFIYDFVHKRYIAPLDLDSVLEPPYWSRSGASMIADLEFALVKMFEELSLHPQELFEKYKKDVLLSLAEYPDIRPPSNTNFSLLRSDVLTRNYVVVYYPQSWLQSLPNEFYDENERRLLAVGRGWAIKPYCQDNLVVSPQSSRSHNFENTLASVPRRKFASETTNNTPHDATDASNIGQEAGASFVPRRTEDSSESFPNASTTRSTNDAAAPKTTITAFKDVDSAILTGPETGAFQEIKGFLGKPQLIASGVFSTTDTVPIALASGQLPADLIFNQPLWKSKIDGNLAFKAKTVLTLQVNANRFQQGRYILAWVPDGGGYEVNSSSTWIKMHSANLCQLTQLPHVEIDLNCDTQAVLEIPLINCIGYVPLVVYSNAGNYKNGIYTLRPYSPLIAPSGSTTANWLLYAHFEDIQFKLPIVPQSGVTRNRSKVSRRSTPEAQEQETGLISGFLIKAKTAANILSAVPLLSSIAAPASWALDIASRVAMTFGWGKPHDYSNINRMVRYIMPRYNNTDTIDTGTKLSIFDTNQIEETAFAGTDIDELSVGYLVSIPAWFSTIVWNESAAEGTLLQSYNICPHDYIVASVYGVSSVVFPTPVAWVSNFYSQWRGSMKFTFKIVKTEFHTGRLQVSFYPYEYVVNNGNATTPTIANTAFLHREIIDIRYGNEFSIVVPYASLTPYRSLWGTDRFTGTMYLQVLNPLVAPGTVSSTVTILVEVSGGTDMEFAFPRSVNETPVVVLTPQSGGSTNICEIVSTEIGNSNVDDTLAPARLCIGERVLSLRSLLKRFNPLIGVSGSPNFYLSFLPWSIPMIYVGPGGTLEYSELGPNADIYSMISTCFALQRGSMRYKILSLNVDANQTMYIRNSPLSNLASTIASISTTLNFTNTTTSVLTSTTFGNGDNNVSTYSAITGGLEVDFPYYGRSFCNPVADVITSSNSLAPLEYDVTGVAPRSIATVAFPVAAHSAVQLFRAVGEDFSLGLFVSVPAYLNWTTNVIS